MLVGKLEPHALEQTALVHAVELGIEINAGEPKRDGEGSGTLSS